MNIKYSLKKKTPPPKVGNSSGNGSADILNAVVPCSGKSGPRCGGKTGLDGKVANGKVTPGQKGDSGAPPPSVG